MVFITTYIIFPSSTEADFTVIFSAGIGAEKKKNRQLNLISFPIQGKKQTCLGFIQA